MNEFICPKCGEELIQLAPVATNKEIEAIWERKRQDYVNHTLQHAIDDVVVLLRALDEASDLLYLAEMNNQRLGELVSAMDEKNARLKAQIDELEKHEQERPFD